jgi:hypothetical protein
LAIQRDKRLPSVGKKWRINKLPGRTTNTNDGERRAGNPDGSAKRDYEATEKDRIWDEV